MEAYLEQYGDNNEEGHDHQGKNKKNEKESKVKSKYKKRNE